MVHDRKKETALEGRENSTCALGMPRPCEHRAYDVAGSEAGKPASSIR